MKKTLYSHTYYYYSQFRWPLAIVQCHSPSIALRSGVSCTKVPDFLRCRLETEARSSSCVVPERRCDLSDTQVLVQHSGQLERAAAGTSSRESTAGTLLDEHAECVAAGDLHLSEVPTSSTAGVGCAVDATIRARTAKNLA